jgi:hypothetical protein
MILRKCFGCEMEMDESTKIYPQKYNNREHFLCQSCNKRWHLYQDKVRAIYAKFDEQKAGELAKAKRDVFGNRPQIVEQKKEPQIKIKAENNARENLEERNEIQVERVMGISDISDGEIDRTGDSFPSDIRE